MNLLRDMFSERGDISSMRVMAMIALLGAIVLAFMGKDASVGALLAFAGGGKVVSKFAEIRGKKNEETVSTNRPS
jgi:hypothetical protein